MLVLSVAGWQALVGSSAVATEPVVPPFDLADPVRIKAGKVRFGATCAPYCHGSEGSGGKAPAFKGRSDFVAESAFRTITTGRRGSDIMPPWGKTFKPEEIWELVAYLQHLAGQPPPQ